MSALDFYFDYRSPYAYLAHTQVLKFGRPVRWLPFDILSLMQQVGNVPTSITCKAKNRYLGADLNRWVSLYGVPFQRHPQAGEIDARRLLRATLLAADHGAAEAAVTRLFGAYWGTGAPLARAVDVADVVSAAGVAGADLAQQMDDPALDARLDAATAAAVERGVFGAPTLFVGAVMFFGNDRLDFVRAELEAAA